MSAAGQKLRELIINASDLNETKQFLDGLPDPERPAAVRCLTPRAQRKLWRLADGFGRVTLQDMVPEGVPPDRPVRHYGRNSLLAFTLFEKRFYRFASHPDGVGGANFQRISKFTGPGYYVARDDVDRGEVLVDYTQVPSEHPAGWPEIVPNERGVSRFIYGNMIDTLRRVSEHVTIGHAARHGKEIPAWFVLCREALL